MLKKSFSIKLKTFGKLKIKCQKNEKWVFSLKTNNVLKYMYGFSKIDYYWVTIASDRKSWGTISCIQCFNSIQNV